MNNYELAVIVSAKIEDGARAEIIERVKEIITNAGGTAIDVNEWGKRRLAYEIQKMKEGFYYFINFESDASVPHEVERRMRIMENVLRYLCVRQCPEAVAAAKAEADARAKEEVAARAKAKAEADAKAAAKAEEAAEAEIKEEVEIEAKAEAEVEAEADVEAEA